MILKEMSFMNLRTTENIKSSVTLPALEMVLKFSQLPDNFKPMYTYLFCVENVYGITAEWH